MEFKFFVGNKKLTYTERHNITWRTATGRQTPIYWMTDNHIRNCLSCLMGLGLVQIPDPYVGRSKSEWINILECELRIREEERQEESDN
jgi:hypothetical protein